jgi:MarR family transcriptional regulator for hemolysin
MGLYTATAKVQGQEIGAALAQSLLLAGRRWRARLNERLKGIGQTDARCAALAEIAGCPEGVVQRELSQRLGVEEPTVVRLVDALEGAEWVERQAHVRDRRAKVVRITPAAQPILDQAQRIVGDMQQELFADMDPGDLATCLRVLNEISAKLERAG